MGSSSPAARRKSAVESFSTAAAAIGKVEAGMSLFAVTRGQWSMIDAFCCAAQLDEIPSFNE